MPITRTVVMGSHRFESPDDEVTRFTYTAIFFHWTIAALILANILLAWGFHAIHGSLGSAILLVHKSIGLSILLLSVLRLAWRLMNPLPPFATTMRAWEKSAAKIVERSLYFVMFALPVTGWAIASTLSPPTPIVLFGIVHWPNIPFLSTLSFDQKIRVYALCVTAHHTLARIMYGLITVHVLAALRHQFVKRDAVLARMIPLLARSKTVAVGQDSPRSVISRRRSSNPKLREFSAAPASPER